MYIYVHTATHERLEKKEKKKNKKIFLGEMEVGGKAAKQRQKETRFQTVFPPVGTAPSMGGREGRGKGQGQFFLSEFGRL